VFYRRQPYLLSQQKYYENVGEVPNVAFSWTALYDQPTVRIAIYHGVSDTVTALAFCKMDEVLAWLKESAMA
jgi:beta-1,4-mannooligosaccharide/beta-1,4-mannosyl-N-acetylglucosamine phosphorylase